MSDSEAWNEYCEASLDLSNQEDVGEQEKESSVKNPPSSEKLPLQSPDELEAWRSEGRGALFF